MKASLAAIALLAIGILTGSCDQMNQRYQEVPSDFVTAGPEAESADTAVVLLPGDDHYALAHIDIGGLAISLDTIKAAGAGSVITLLVGNTIGAGLEDLSATLQWGPVDASNDPQISDERTREVPVAHAVPAGKWTTAYITLADVPPAELRFIRLTNIDYTALILK